MLKYNIAQDNKNVNKNKNINKTVKIIKNSKG